ncbi:hypothetical protein VTN02DRAFT_247 [Thermoascus thermophilus]
MKFAASLFTNLVLAGAALAAPRGRGLVERAKARGKFIHLSHPFLPSPSDLLEGGHDRENTTHGANVQYSGNWAGGVIESPPAGQTFNAVSAVFTVPNPPSSSGSVGRSAAASAWVGIDGDTYQNAILQTGVDLTVDEWGSVSYDAWYEWYPDYAYDFDLPISAGDVISLSVVASSSSEGTVVIENLTQGQTVTQTLSAPSPSATLGGQNAEWIVEDFQQNGQQVPFANFGTVLFQDTVAKTASETLDASSATILDIRQNGQVLTQVTIPSSSEIEVQYQ